MENRNQLLPLLPVEVWSTITSYATSPASECNGDNSSPMSALRCASRAFRLLLTSDVYYQARVSNTIRTLDEHRGARMKPGIQPGFANQVSSSSEYPHAKEVGGYANLLKVIVQCAPLEGWYTISDSWPWWLLVRMKFSGGKFCGDIVSASTNPCDCRRVERIFELSFDSSGNAQCKVAGKTAENIGVLWKGGANSQDVFQSPHTRSPSRNDNSFPHHNGLMLQISDILKDCDNASSAWPGQITDYRFGTSIRSPPPTFALIELLLERDMPLKCNKGSFRRPSDTNQYKRYYQNELVFEYLYAIQGRPLINGKEVYLEELVIGHSIKSF